MEASPTLSDAVKSVTAVLLAAGSSRRFGGDKQSAPLGGEALLVRATRMLLAAGFLEPLVVLRADADHHRALLADLPVRVVSNADAASGMATSLRCALQAAPTARALLITVCDQPAVTPQHLLALVAQWRLGSRLVASRYGETRGVPALFSPEHFPELGALSGDRGAGPVLARHLEAATVPLPSGEWDIDTPADLARWPGMESA